MTFEYAVNMMIVKVHPPRRIEVSAYENFEEKIHMYTKALLPARQILGLHFQFFFFFSPLTDLTCFPVSALLVPRKDSFKITAVSRM